MATSKPWRALGLNGEKELGTDVAGLFPKLKNCTWEITSAESVLYNCVAWAMHEKRRNWWPVFYYWPPGAVREETVEACRQAFAIFGFEVCNSSDPEEGFEKVALYAKGVEFTHVALQLPNGQWSSKLGELEDIQHGTLQALEGGDYGNVALVMRKARTMGDLLRETASSTA